MVEKKGNLQREFVHLSMVPYHTRQVASDDDDVLLERYCTARVTVMKPLKKATRFLRNISRHFLSFYVLSELNV